MDNGDHNNSFDTYKSYESDATDDSLGRLVIDEGTDNSPSNNKTDNKSKILDKIDCSTNNDYNVVIKEISCDSKEVIKNNFDNDLNNTENKNVTANNCFITENNLSEKNESDQNSVNGKSTRTCPLDTTQATKTSENDQSQTIFTSTTVESPTTTHNNNITTNSSMKCHNFSKNIFTEFSCNSTSPTTLQTTKQSNNVDKKFVYSSKKVDNLKNKPTFDIKNLCNNFSSFKHIDSQTNNIVDRNKQQKGNKVINNNNNKTPSTVENFVASPTTTTSSKNKNNIKNKINKNNVNSIYSDNVILNNNNYNNTNIKNVTTKEIVDFSPTDLTSICVNSNNIESDNNNINNNNNNKISDTNGNNKNSTFLKKNINSDVIPTNNGYNNNNNDNTNIDAKLNNDNNNKIDNNHKTNNNNNNNNPNNHTIDNNNNNNNDDNNSMIKNEDLKGNDMEIDDKKATQDINHKNSDSINKNIDSTDDNKININNTNNNNINNSNDINKNDSNDISNIKSHDMNNNSNNEEGVINNVVCGSHTSTKEERCFPSHNISIKKERFDEEEDVADANALHHIKEERNNLDTNNFNNINNINTNQTSNNYNDIDDKLQAKEMMDKKPKINTGGMVDEEEDEDEDEYYIENIVDGFSLVSFSKLSDLEHFIKHTEKNFEEECRRRMMGGSNIKDARSKKNQKINKKQPTSTISSVLPKSTADNNNNNNSISTNSSINNNINNNTNNSNNNNSYKMSGSSNSSSLNNKNNKTTSKKGRAAKENNNITNNTRKKRKSTKNNYYYEDEDSDEDDDDESSDATVEENIDQSYMDIFRENNNNNNNRNNNNNNNNKSNKYDECVKKTFEDSNSGMENYESKSNKLYNNNPNAAATTNNVYNQGQHFLKRQATNLEYNREQKKLKIDLDNNNNLQASPAISIDSNNNSKTFSPKKEMRHRSPTPDDVVLVLDDPNQTGVSWVRSFPGLRFSNDQQLKTNSCLEGCARTDVTYDGSKIKKRNRYSNNMGEKKLQQHNNTSRQKPATKMPFKQTSSNRNIESSSIDRLPPFKPFISPPYNNTPSYNNYPPNHTSNYNNPGFCIPMPTIPPPIPAHQQTSFFMNGWNQFELLAQMANQEMLRVQQGLNERFLAGGGEASGGANGGGQSTASQGIRPVPVLGSGINIPVALPGLNNGMAPTLTLRTEMHQHLHHHQHVIPTYPPTNPTIPSLTHVQPPIQPPMYYQAPNNLFLLTSSNLRPSFSNRGAFVPMADQRSNQLPASQMLAKFRDGNWKSTTPGSSTSGSKSSGTPVRGSFKGKWCSTHVQLAWRILMHTRALKQHKNNSDEYTAFNKNNSMGGPYDPPYNPTSTSSFYPSPYNASVINSKKEFLREGSTQF